MECEKSLLVWQEIQLKLLLRFLYGFIIGQMSLIKGQYL